MESRGRSRRRNGSRVLKRRLSTVMAWVLTISMVLGNLGSVPNIVLAGQNTQKEEYRLHVEDIQKAAEEAIYQGEAMSEALAVSGKDKSLVKEYEKLFEAEGTLYEIFPKYETVQDADGIELRVFIRIDADADPASYALTGEEELIFLYVNGGSEPVAARLNIDGYMTGFSTVKPHEAEYGETAPAPIGNGGSGAPAGNGGTGTTGGNGSGSTAGGDSTDGASGSISGSEVESTAPEDSLPASTEGMEEETGEMTEGETEAESSTGAEAEGSEAQESSSSEEDGKETGADETSSETEASGSEDTEATTETESEGKPAESETQEPEETEKPIETEAPAEKETEEKPTESETEETEAASKPEESEAETGSVELSMSWNEVQMVAAAASPSDAESSKDTGSGDHADSSGTDSDYEDSGEPFDAEDAAALKAEEEAFKKAGYLDGKLYNQITLDESMTARAYVIPFSKIGVDTEELVEGAHLITYTVGPVGTAKLIKAPERVRDEAVVTFGILPQTGYMVQQVTANGNVIEKADDSYVASLSNARRARLASDSDAEKEAATEEELENAIYYVIPDVLEEQEVEVVMVEEVIGSHPKFEQAVDMGDVTVTVSAEEGILPAGTKAEVKEVTEQVAEAVKEKVEGEADQENPVSVTSVLAYDITLYDAEGNMLDNSWSSNGYVHVEFSGKQIEEKSKEADSVEVMHLETETDPTQKKVQKDEVKHLEKVSKTEVPGDEAIAELAFEAEHFSTYTVVFQNNGKTRNVTIHLMDVDTGEELGLLAEVLGSTNFNVSDYTYTPSDQYGELVFRNESMFDLESQIHSDIAGIVENKVFHKVTTEAYLNSMRVNSVGYDDSTWKINSKKGDRLGADLYFWYKEPVISVIFHADMGAAGTQDIVIKSEEAAVAKDGMGYNVYAYALTTPDPEAYGISKEGYTFVGWSYVEKGDGKSTSNEVDNASNFVPGVEIKTTEARTYYAIWLDNDAVVPAAGTKPTSYYIQKEGGYPFEPSAYPNTDYYKIPGNYNVKEYINVNNNLANVKQNLGIHPSDEDVFNYVNSQINQPRYNTNDYKVEWYVIKQPDSWHVDGTIVPQNAYHVSYDPNGGNIPVPPTSTYIAGKIVNVDFTSNPTRVGYEFLGWSENSTDVTPQYSNNTSSTFTMPERDVVLYAVWKRTYTANEDKPFIRVKKTFEGLDYKSITKLWDNGFKIELMLGSASSVPAATLTRNNLTRIEGTNTYVWEVEGLEAGTYYIKESNEDTLQEIHLGYDGLTTVPEMSNGGVTITDSSFDVNNVYETFIPNCNDTTINIQEKIEAAHPDGYEDGSFDFNLLVISIKGTVTKAQSYIIWTKNTLSVMERKTVLESVSSGKIGSNITDPKATIYYYSDEPGENQLSTTGIMTGGGLLKYDSEMGTLSFLGSTSSWQQIICNRYDEQKAEGADIALFNKYSLKNTSFAVQKKLQGSKLPAYDLSLTEDERPSVIFNLYKQQEGTETLFKTVKFPISGFTEAENDTGWFISSPKIFDNIEAGTYYLEEVNGIPGYEGLKERITITVSYDDKTKQWNIVTSENGKGVQWEVSSTEGDKPLTLFTVKNYLSVVLPETGGPGLIMFERFGWALLLLALLGLTFTMLEERRKRTQ